MKEAMITILLAAVLVVLLFGLAARINGGLDSSPAQQQQWVDIKDRPILPYNAPTEAERFHGLAIQLHNNDLLDGFAKAIDEVAATGADTVLLSLAAYQEHAGSSTIQIDLRKSPNHEQLVELIGRAKKHGMRVIVMPIVLLRNPRGNEWRGKIQPDDLDRWWAEYREYIKYYAKAAQAGGADLLMIGSELNRMEAHPDRWRALARFLRKNWPELKLGYSANWDRYWKVSFWDVLDYAGVTTYYELAPAGTEEPAVDDLVKAWAPHKQQLVDWQKTIGIPVIFTEVGWYSRKGAASRPWDYYYNEGKPSMIEQANLYKSFLEVWKGQDMVGGVIFWEWSLSAGGETDEGYTPKGKLAEQVLRDYFRKFARRPSPASQPEAKLN